jgi:AcrR family transcriptional regulator
MDDETAEERVLEVADRLFYEQGMRTVGMDQIRDASGVSLKRLYRLFPAKDELAEVVLRRREEAFLRSLGDAAAAAAGPREAILGFFDDLHEWFTEPDYRGCPFINAFAEMRSTSQPITAVAVHQKRALERHLDGLVRAAGAPPALTSQLLILANGAMATSAMLGSPEAARQARAAAAALLDAAEI